MEGFLLSTQARDQEWAKECQPGRGGSTVGFCIRSGKVITFFAILLGVEDTKVTNHVNWV